MKTSRKVLLIGQLVLVSAAHAQSAPAKTYIVQLADPPVAAYGGGLAGIAATKAAAGTKLNVGTANARSYASYLTARQNSALALAGGVVPLHRYSVAFNGFSAKLSDAQVRALRSSADVKAVVESKVRKMDTTRTPAFLGLPAPGGLWSQLDAASRQVKGEDVIVGVIDSGIWPEDASFGDKVDAAGRPVPYHQSGTLAYAPLSKWKGTCQTGPGFAQSMCNNKLIGARVYGDDFAAQGGLPSSLEYASPRDAQGHGSHTASTAAGNSGSPAIVDGVDLGRMSGIAPRARVAAYKVCWEASDENYTGCFPGDVLKAIDDAISDGVDVINYSVAGTQFDFADPIEIAYLNATAAGVFVATTAGNQGPGNQVAHISPWVTTVAASTHDRYLVANAVLGTGLVLSGPSYQLGGLPARPAILARDAGRVPFASLEAVDQIALQRCYNDADRAPLGASVNGTLDPAKVAGKVVVCYRGGNALISKADVVKAAGGVAMVLQNVPALPPGLPASNDALVLQPYSVPTVHLAAASYGAVSSYVAGSGAATIAFSPGVQQPDVVAPVMAAFSSRGPNKANGDILKPDIAAPGVDIIAAYVDGSITQAQHDALAVGNFTPKSNATAQQGTSMASPHIAGVAALLKQMHPGWSPAAIKSAMMTTTIALKLPDGSKDGNRWGYGSGNVNPNGAGDPGLVYDIRAAEYGTFLCGRGLTPPPGLGTCAELGDSLLPANLNLASITAAGVNRSRKLTRTVTNVGPAQETYLASASLPNWTVAVTPATLTLAPGESRTFTVELTASTAAVGAWSFGELVWASASHVVRSPLSANAKGFAAPAEVSDKRASGNGTKTYSVVAAYNGPMTLAPTSLVPARVETGTVATRGLRCVDVGVVEGTELARFQLFNEDTQGGAATNLDLEVFRGSNGTGVSVGASAGATSDETVTLTTPAAGTYSVCVAGTSTPVGGSRYGLSIWQLAPSSNAPNLRTAAPSSVFDGRSATVGLAWSVAAGQRYLGMVKYLEARGATLGSSLVLVDNR